MEPCDTLEITWYGHSMFAVSGGGLAVVVDPVPPEVGYRYEPVSADIVLVTHGHFDHSYLAGVTGDPGVIDDSGPHKIGGVDVTGIASFHDPRRGEERGGNVIYTWEQAGFRLAHFGDLGDVPGAGDLDSLHGLHLAMIPVGGVYTIDGGQAALLAADISPGVVIPMHFATPDCVIPLDPIDSFSSSFDGPVREIIERPLSITIGEIPPATEAWILPYR